MRFHRFVHFLLLCGLLLPGCREEVIQIQIVMLGDSLTAAGHWNRLLGRVDVMNRGRGGDTTEEMLARLPADVVELGPRICFLMGGANDRVWLSQERSTKALEHLRRMIEQLQAASIQPVLHSVLPVAPGMPGAEARNVGTHAFNAQLDSLAHATGVDVMDLRPQLAPRGWLEAVFSTDGLHLQPVAYEIWAREIMHYLQAQHI